MIEYIIESIFCSAILYLCFLAFFKKARNLHANRFILLFSIVFFLLVPCLDLSSSNAIDEEVMGSGVAQATLSTISIASNQAIGASKDFYDNWRLFNPILLYVLISVLLLGRFVFNLYALLSGKFVVERIIHKGYKLAFFDKETGPFSFFRTIYVNKESFDSGKIDDELLMHEVGHIRQWHSIDILFVELVQAFFWFNPFVFLFKKRIQANHEFLADEFVVHSGANKRAYSHKLIDYTAQGNRLNLTSGFTYSLIKNRLIMLSKYDQRSRFFYRLPLFIATLATLLLTTAFTNLATQHSETNKNEAAGFFYADTLFWSGKDQKLYLRGDVVMKALDNDVKGKGSFSFFGKVHLLMVNDRKVTLNSSLDVSGMKCEVIVLSANEAKAKYGEAGKLGAVEINTRK